MHNNKVDIILPVYNSKSFILETLRSIIIQTHKNWSVIIVDDGSTDSSVDLINKFIKSSKYKKKFILIKNKIHKGQAFSRNLALKYCNSKFIAFIDSDDIWHKNKLKKQVNFMLKKNFKEYNFSRFEVM